MKLMQDRQAREPDPLSMLVGFVTGFLLGLNLAVQLLVRR